MNMDAICARCGKDYGSHNAFLDWCPGTKTDKFRESKKSILDLAVDIAFTQAAQDLNNQYQRALEGISERLRQLRDEVALIQKAEANHDPQ